MEMAPIALIGLSFQSAPLAVRERLSIGICNSQENYLIDNQKDGLNNAFSAGQIISSSQCAWLQEWVLLSTCNRIELYAAVAPGLDELDDHDFSNFDLGKHLGQIGSNGRNNHPELNDQPGNHAGSHLIDTRTLLEAFLAKITGVDAAEFTSYAYFYQDEDTAEHLLRVAAGLESQALGEPQILGQVTNAYMTAVGDKNAGPVLTELFKAAIRTGKRSRTETMISNNSMSMSSMAIAQARSVTGDLTNKNCLVVGLGEMGRLALKQLQIRGVQNISVINRTNERAVQLAQQMNHRAYRWQDLAQALQDADIVISATSAPVSVITKDLVLSALAGREARPIILLDIAVPRDVAPEVRQIPGVHLWDAGELKGNLDEARMVREGEIPAVEQIIEEEKEALWTCLRTLAVKPVVVRLREKAERIRRQELERTLNHLGEVDEQTLEHFQFLSRSLVNKLLHDPTVRLKDKAGKDQANGYVQAINDLFDLK